MTTLYRSETRETTFDALPAALRDALAREARDLGVDLGGARVWSTRCINPPGEGLIARVFGRRANPVDPDDEHTMGLALLPTHLVVGASGVKAGATALGIALVQLTVKRGSVLAARLGPDVPRDDGITLDGFPASNGRRGSYFFKLGGAEADACFAAVDAAVRSRQ